MVTIFIVSLYPDVEFWTQRCAKGRSHRRIWTIGNFNPAL